MTMMIRRFSMIGNGSQILCITAMRASCPTLFLRSVYHLMENTFPHKSFLFFLLLFFIVRCL
ncbi:hypothetical protein MKW92_051786 [Papaver armeniacum]|nr:hypothetical protein MKW92_051786 [Papaver armeniacum]